VSNSRSQANGNVTLNCFTQDLGKVAAHKIEVPVI
jgi:hypothetical protein